MPKEEIKLTEEEITKITDIRKNYFNIQSALGQVELTKINLGEQLRTMDNQHGSITEEYAKTQSGERELVKGLQDKYGVGSLNLESGTFVPAPEQPKPTETSK
tara:strand:+ start:181 stop:489 length:309 start_codon:yes stop_codon:yes gene_type:complete